MKVLSPEVPEAAEVVARGALDRTPVSRIMARHVVCVHGDMPLRDVAEVLVRRRFGGVPVVDDEFRPLGMVSKTDLLRHSFEDAGETLEEIAAPIPVIPRVPCCEAEVMTPSVVSLGERASVLEAAAMMAERHLHRLPVVGRDERIVGVVSSLDVLAWISRDLPQGEGVSVPPE